MRRRQLIMPLFICIVTIFLITKMVTAHAEDSSDESAYPTPTDVIDVIETPLPTMTEYAYDESDPPTDPTETPTPTATTQPPDTDLTTTTIVIDTNPTAEALPLSDTTIAQDDLAMVTSMDTPTPVALASTMSTRDGTVRTCATDTIEVFEGITTPNTMLEVRFDMRVVGGGMSTPSGRYLIPVYIGDEVSGSHTISIVKRYTGRLLQQVSCDTP
jgi:hypothetical protein